MKQLQVPLQIPGREVVIEWFGEWPSFHDAEIVALRLARSGSSLLQVYPYYPRKPATVNFIFDEVTDVELSDFSVQNVIIGLDIEQVTDQTKSDAIRVTLGPCFGLSGRIDAKRLRLEVVPGKCPDSVSQW